MNKSRLLFLIQQYGKACAVNAIEDEHPDWAQAQVNKWMASIEAELNLIPEKVELHCKLNREPLACSLVTTQGMLCTNCKHFKS